MEAAATSIEKAVDLLFHLHDLAEPQGVTAIGRALGLPKSSAHRMLRSLGRRGLVERDERGRYRPGLGLLALGLGIVDREPLAAAARAVLEAEALALGETFFLVVARAGELVVLDKAEGTGFLRAAPQVGSRVPVHATLRASSISPSLRSRLRWHAASRTTRRFRRSRGELPLIPWPWRPR